MIVRDFAGPIGPGSSWPYPAPQPNAAGQIPPERTRYRWLICERRRGRVVGLVERGVCAAGDLGNASRKVSPGTQTIFCDTKVGCFTG